MISVINKKSLCSSEKDSKNDLSDGCGDGGGNKLSIFGSSKGHQSTSNKPSLSTIINRLKMQQTETISLKTIETSSIENELHSPRSEEPENKQPFDNSLMDYEDDVNLFNNHHTKSNMIITYNKKSKKLLSKNNDNKDKITQQNFLNKIDPYLENINRVNTVKEEYENTVNMGDEEEGNDEDDEYEHESLEEFTQNQINYFKSIAQDQQLDYKTIIPFIIYNFRSNLEEKYSLVKKKCVKKKRVKINIVKKRTKTDYSLNLSFTYNYSRGVKLSNGILVTPKNIENITNRYYLAKYLIKLYNKETNYDYVFNTKSKYTKPIYFKCSHKDCKSMICVDYNYDNNTAWLKRNTQEHNHIIDNLIDNSFNNS